MTMSSIVGIFICISRENPWARFFVYLRGLIWVYIVYSGLSASVIIVITVPHSIYILIRRPTIIYYFAHLTSNNSNSITGCEVEPPVKNGKPIPPKFNTVGSIMVYKCALGHEPTGTPEVQCMPNGEWSVPVFKCIICEYNDIFVYHHYIYNELLFYYIFPNYKIRLHRIEY